jgi:hypothetical protein
MEQIIGQIQAFGFGFAPAQWAFCDGQIMSIAQNTALFSLIGTTFGGNGQTTFALPDLRGRSIVHPGTGPGLTNIQWGQSGGAESITLTTSNIPPHVHQLVPGTGAGQVNVQTVIHTSAGSPINESDNGNNGFGSGGAFPNTYSEPPLTATDKVGNITTSISGTTGIAGSGLPFSIRSPYLGIYTSIALYGIFPSRN